jgi:hypothetical protein
LIDRKGKNLSIYLGAGVGDIVRIIAEFCPFIAVKTLKQGQLINFHPREENNYFLFLRL